MILVLGATGNTGSEVVRLLSARGEKVRAMVRNPAKASSLNALGVEVVTGDLAKPDTLDQAFQGATRLYLTTPPSLGQETLQLNAIAAARRADIRHVVKLSAIGATSRSPVTFLRQHATIEKELRSSGIGWTVLQPNFFMQNFMSFAGSIAASGMMFAPAGDGKASLIDARDIAAVAAVVLTADGHEGKAYVLTGPEALSHADTARKIGQAAGRAVTYVNVAPDAARRAMVESGTPEWLADDLVALLHRIYASGVAATVTSTVRDITGQEPRTFDAFALEHADVFSAAPAPA